MNNNGMDERQQLINTKAFAAVGVLLYICVCVATIWRIVTTEELGWEFWAVIGASLVMIIARRVMGDAEVPKSILDKPLPTGSSREERAVRKREYTIQSLLFSTICTVVDVLLVCFGKDDVADYEVAELLFPQLNKPMTVVVTAVIAFVVTFVISWLVDYLVGEYRIKRYNRMLAELDDDE